MNSLSESARRAAADVHEVSMRGAYDELIRNEGCAYPAAMVPLSARERRNDLSVQLVPAQREARLIQSDPNNEFLAVICHELRNSLGAIHGAACILRMQNNSGPAAEKARAVIERQVTQMTVLVEDLLGVSQVQSGRLRLRRERVDLGIVASHAAQSVEFTMQQRHHRMTTSFPDAPLWLEGDSAKLGQVIVNLLLNAAKYTDAGGDIDLRVHREKGEAVVCIRDTGIGIAPDVLPRVFELFVQADSSARRADGGLGIGLAVVRGLVEAHGGHVTAASGGLRQGSTFTVRLPAAAE